MSRDAKSGPMEGHKAESVGLIESNDRCNAFTCTCAFKLVRVVEVQLFAPCGTLLSYTVTWNIFTPKCTLSYALLSKAGRNYGINWALSKALDRRSASFSLSMLTSFCKNTEVVDQIQERCRRKNTVWPTALHLSSDDYALLKRTVSILQLIQEITDINLRRKHG